MLDVDPDRWQPSRDAATPTLPRPGLKVAWRYATWRITAITPRAETDWTDDDRAYLDRQPAEQRTPPYTITLKHLNGPLLVSDDSIDYQGLLHIAVPARAHRTWWGVAKRYPTCSCHGHPWPCIETDRDRLIAAQTARTERLMAGTWPGTCAACLQPVTRRQRTITFPEPSLLVPGSPGPTYHAGRHDCWWAARDYEIHHRLQAHPEVTRLASCPGDVFVHEKGLWVECTAGPACTELHQPVGAPKPTTGTCATRVRQAGNLAAGYRRPLTDCGYRGRMVACLGAETGSCEPLPDGIADLFGGQ